MAIITQDLVRQYRSFLEEKGIAAVSQADFIKWLRYYLHFCDTHQVSELDSERLRLYLGKLREKHQDAERRRQAAWAVALYLEMQRQPTGPHRKSPLDL